MDSQQSGEEIYERPANPQPRVEENLSDRFTPIPSRNIEKRVNIS